MKATLKKSVYEKGFYQRLNNVLVTPEVSFPCRYFRGVFQLLCGSKWYAACAARFEVN